MHWREAQGVWRRRLPLLLLVLAATFATSTRSGAAAGQPAGRLAVLDMSRLFAGNQRLRAAIDDLIADIQAFDQETRSQRRQLALREDRLRKWPAGTAAYRREAAALTARAARIDANVELRRRLYTDREAKIYSDAYGDTMRQIERFCREHHIALLLRSGAAATPLRAEESAQQQTQQQIDRLVVYSAAPLDVTSQLMDRINSLSSPQYGKMPLARNDLPRPIRFIHALPGLAIQRVAMSRAARAVDRLVFPPAS